MEGAGLHLYVFCSSKASKFSKARHTPSGHVQVPSGLSRGIESGCRRLFKREWPGEGGQGEGGQGEGDGRSPRRSGE